jgi:glycerol-3-phosphate O-acyltransferase/dihydroxyacetone phosphate acyltransferase
MLLYRPLRELLRLSMLVFFRRVQVTGAEQTPEAGAVIFYGNHPNSLLDPALLTAFAPREVHFAAKDTLFSHPALRWLLTQMGAVPLRRRQDHSAGEGAPLNNDSAFEALHALLARGGAMGIFPEGVSHEGAELAELKTGAARIALGALAQGISVSLVPCGLHYLKRRRFRTSALIQLGAPLTLTPTAAPLTPRELTEQMELHLRALTVNGSSWESVTLLDTARRVYQPPGLGLRERVELMRRFNLYYPQIADQEEVISLTRALEAYQEDLEDLSLTDREVAGDLSASALTARAARQGLALCVWAPLAVIGAPLHLPIAYALRHGSALLAPRKDVIATTKFLAGFLCLNGLYVSAGVCAWWLGVEGWRAALVPVLLGLSGFATLKVSERAGALWRVVWVCARCVSAKETLRDLRARRRALRERVWAVVDAYAPEGLARVVSRGG